ncbi:MAG: GNAT family N-acetyltransferase [Anaerolineales bacterium]
MKDLDSAARQQAAETLVIAFKEHSPEAWPTIEEGLNEVKESLGDGHISRAAVNEHGRVLGWIGGVDAYHGHGWELHPLAVHPDAQRQGVGEALVRDLEEQVRIRGGGTIFLGSDDENNMTSLSGIDLYPDVLAHLQNIKDLKGHPFVFYQKLGYVIVGVIPDANGFGKPDILMAKRISAVPS